MNTRQLLSKYSELDNDYGWPNLLRITSGFYSDKININDHFENPHNPSETELNLFEMKYLGDWFDIEYEHYLAQLFYNCGRLEN